MKRFPNHWVQKCKILSAPKPIHNPQRVSTVKRSDPPVFPAYLHSNNIFIFHVNCQQEELACSLGWNKEALFMYLRIMEDFRAPCSFINSRSSETKRCKFSLKEKHYAKGSFKNVNVPVRNLLNFLKLSDNFNQTQKSSVCFSHFSYFYSSLPLPQTFCICSNPKNSDVSR